MWLVITYFLVFVALPVSFVQKVLGPLSRWTFNKKSDERWLSTLTPTHRKNIHQVRREDRTGFILGISPFVLLGLLLI